GIYCFTRQCAGFIAAGRLVKEVREEILQCTYLGRAELDLRFQHKGGVGISIAQAALQQIPFQGIAVLTYLYLAPSAKQGEVAENCGVVPAVTLAFKALQQAFDRCANATASIG